MEISVFISLIVSAIIGIVLPIIAFIGLVISKKVKILQIVKGILISIVVNMIILRLFLTAIVDMMGITSLYSLTMLIAFVVYSMISLGIQYYVFKNIMNIKEKPEYTYQIALGYGSIYAFSLTKVVFSNLIMGDHIRVNDLDFLEYMGVGNIEQVVNLFTPQHIGYFLSIGLQILIVLGIQLLIVYFIYQYMQNKSQKSLVFATGFIFIAQIMLFYSVSLQSTLLFIMTLIVFIAILYCCWKIYKNRLNLIN